MDFGSVLISGGAGALTGGLSTLGGKGTQVAISTGIDAAESIAKQVNSGNGVTLTKTVTDVVGEKVGGALTKKLDNVLDTKVLRKDLDRATRVSQGDPTSTGRKSTVDKLTKQLKTKDGVIQVSGQASQQSTGDVVQYSLDNVIGSSKSSAGTSTTVASDATFVAPTVRPLPKKTNE